jgi:hypothetical protein
MDATTNVLQLPHLRPTSIAIIMLFIRKKEEENTMFTWVISQTHCHSHSNTLIKKIGHTLIMHHTHEAKAYYHKENIKDTMIMAHQPMPIAIGKNNILSWLF